MNLSSGLLSLAFSLTTTPVDADELPITTQARLRRAVSTAYYALFHALCDAAVATMPAEPAGLQALVRRTMDHGSMKAVCEQWSTRKDRINDQWRSLMVEEVIPESITTVAQAFVQLQLQRHLADYALGPALVYDKDRAMAHVTQASVAVITMHDMAFQPGGSVFLAMLLTGGKAR